MLRFIHTSDWQIGKAFGGFPDDVRGVLREARIETVRTIGRLATENGAAHVLVAGDVYDIEEPSDLTLMRPIEAMRAFPTVNWHLIPGNHDSAGSQGIWTRMLQRGIPENIHLHLEPRPAVLAENAMLLPSPLPRRRTVGDLTAWTEEVATPEGMLRIGMAHGPVVGFSGDGEMTDNLVPPDRPERSGLDYLAMGDWHRGQRIAPRLYYSGTHETDRFKSGPEESRCGGGTVLLVEIEAPGALPVVSEARVGRYMWHDLQARLMEDADIDALIQRLGGLGDAGSILVRLGVEGALSLGTLARFDDLIVARMGASFVHLDIDRLGLVPQPSDEDLEMIDKGGFVRAASEKLRALGLSEDQSVARTARRALIRLYLEARETQGSARGGDQ